VWSSLVSLQSEWSRSEAKERGGKRKRKGRERKNEEWFQFSKSAKPAISLSFASL